MPVIGDLAIAMALPPVPIPQPGVPDVPPAQELEPEPAGGIRPAAMRGPRARALSAARLFASAAATKFGEQGVGPFGPEELHRYDRDYMMGCLAAAFEADGDSLNTAGALAMVYAMEHLDELLNPNI